MKVPGNGKESVAVIRLVDGASLEHAHEFVAVLSQRFGKEFEVGDWGSIRNRRRVLELWVWVVGVSQYADLVYSHGFLEGDFACVVAFVFVREGVPEQQSALRIARGVEEHLVVKARNAKEVRLRLCLLRLKVVDQLACLGLHAGFFMFCLNF